MTFLSWMADTIDLSASPVLWECGTFGNIEWRSLNVCINRCFLLTNKETINYRYTLTVEAYLY